MNRIQTNVALASIVMLIVTVSIILYVKLDSLQTDIAVVRRAQMLK